MAGNSLVLFSKERGNVVALEDATMPATVLFHLEGWEGFDGFRAIVTSVAVASQGNFQFLHSLGGNIYVYVFGDRVGEAVISGLAFDRPCDNSDKMTGVEHVMQYYVDNRIAQRRTPLKLTIGAQRAIVGYLVSFSAKVADPKDGIYEFSLSFMVPPPSSTRLCRTDPVSDDLLDTSQSGTDTPPEIFTAPYPTDLPAVSVLPGTTPGTDIDIELDIGVDGDWAGDYGEVPTELSGVPGVYYQGGLPLPGVG